MLSVRSLMRSAGAVGGALVLLASGASAAVAAPATFSTTGTVQWMTTAANPVKLSWGPNPWQNRTCAPSSLPGTGTTSNSAGQGALTFWYWAPGSLTCTDGIGRSFPTTILSTGSALATVTAGSYSLTSPRLQVFDGGGPGLLPATTAVTFSAPFTNGTTGINGANPSTWAFSNTLVGYVIDPFSGNGAVPLRLTGTFRTGASSNVPLTLIG